MFSIFYGLKLKENYAKNVTYYALETEKYVLVIYMH